MDENQNTEFTTAEPRETLKDKVAGLALKGTVTGYVVAPIVVTVAGAVLAWKNYKNTKKTAQNSEKILKVLNDLKESSSSIGPKDE